MFKPGYSFADYFLLGVTFLPLLPALLILVRRLYGQEPFNFLAVICLLCFFQGFIGGLSPVGAGEPYPAFRIISLVLFLFFFLTFRSNLGGRFRYALNLFMTALVSVICTYWSLKGWGDASLVPETVLDGFLVVIIGVSLPTLIRNAELRIFRIPLFWIEGGSLFYLLLILLLDGIGGGHLTGGTSDPEKKLFLGLAGLLRYLSYIIAVFSL
ncbi:hypothetical protein [Puia sp.]|jgi:hypothetical protein|uniref:hypothetical protein n=1 Tax=Puia sp. TaxID=2045100 RepID=UPI002F4202AE